MLIPSRCSCLVQKRFHCSKTDRPDKTGPRVFGDPDPCSTTTKHYIEISLVLKWIKVYELSADAILKR